MSDRFSWDQKLIIDRDNRNMADPANNIPMGTELNAIWAAIDQGAIGITANPYDVDAVARAGGVFSHNEGSTSGLTWAHRGGQVLFGQTVVTVAAGTVTLTASAVNYVEVDSAGVVSTHTSPAAFTAGKVPLYKITCGSAAISLKENCRVLLVGNHAGVVVGAMLSTAGKTKTLPFRLGTLTKDTVDTYLLVIAPNFAGTFSGVRLAVKTAVPKNDTDYWTITCVNKSNSDKAMLAASPDNTTMNTGGFPLVAYTAKPLNLHGTAGNLVTAALDCLLFKITRTGTVATTYDLVDATVEFDVTHEV